MRYLALLWSMGAIAAYAAPPSEPALQAHSSARDLKAIHDLIDDQIAAFRRGDAQGAWRHTAPGIREKFGTPERFLEMVRTGYPAVYAPLSYRFGDLIPTPDGLGQWLDVTGPDGRPVGALYLLERQPDGTWRTSGCLLTEPVSARPDT